MIQLMRCLCLLLSLFLLLLGCGVSVSSSSRGPEKNVWARQYASWRPDYAQSEFWWARPGFEKSSADLPDGELPNPYEREVDVFFIGSPGFDEGRSTYSKSVDADQHLSLRYQASAFNEIGHIYAPKYRFINPQLISSNDSSRLTQVLEEAYSDVEESFNYYLQHFNQGKPIVVVAHGQGAMIGIRLLKAYFDAKPLYTKLVCAYLVGEPVPVGIFEAIPLGVHPQQTGCFLAWHTAAEKVRSVSDKLDRMAVNPVTWLRDTTATAAREHRGAWLEGERSLRKNVLETQLDSSGRLLVKVPKDWSDVLRSEETQADVDLSLFWKDVRENVKLRLGAFYK